MSRDILIALTILSIAVLLLALSINLSVHFIVVILKSIFGLSENNVSIVVTLFYILKMLILYVLSVMLSRFSIHMSRLLLYAALGSLIINISLLFSINFAQWFITLWILQAIPIALLTTSAYSEALMLLKEHSHFFGIFRGTVSSVYVLAPLIAGLVVEHWKLRGLILVAIVFSLASISLLMLYLHIILSKLFKTTYSRVKMSGSKGGYNFRRLIEKSFPHLLWLTLLLEGIGLGIFTIAFPLVLLSKDFSYSEIGAIEASTSLLSPFSSVVGGFITRVVDPLVLASIGLMIGAFATFSYAYLNQFAEYLVAATIASIGFSLFFTTWPIAYRRIYKEVRAEDLSLLFLAFDLGNIIGTYVGGPLYSVTRQFSLVIDATFVGLASILVILQRKNIINIG